MPTRSPGCFMCRKRKIRCDETRPSCTKCATHGVTCPGYRTERKGGLEFKDLTADTVQRARARGGYDDSSTSSSTSSSSESVLSVSAAGLGAAVTGFTTLLSPAVHRAALYNTFLDLYLPQTDQLDHFAFFNVSQYRNLAYLYTLATLPTTQSALVEGLDALSLVTVGNRTQDPVLLNQAVRTYAQGLRSLTRALSRAEGVKNDDIFATITVFAICELYDAIGATGAGWGKHVEGIEQLIAARGPESIQSPLSHLLFSNARHGALLFALIIRKAPLMARPDWRAVSNRGPTYDASLGFYDVALQIPGLLELGDGLTREERFPSIEEIDELLLDCKTIHSALLDWYSSWSLTVLVGTGIPVFAEMSIEAFPTFTGLCPDRIFQTAYNFPSFPVAYLASLHWMCLHALLGTIQSLHLLRHRLDDEWFPSPDDSVAESDLLELVLDLCRVMPFFCEPISSSTGHIAMFVPLRTAAIYFTTHAMWPEAKWVGMVRMSVFTKGLSPPNLTNDPVQKMQSKNQRALVDFQNAMGPRKITGRAGDAD